MIELDLANNSKKNIYSIESINPMVSESFLKEMQKQDSISGILKDDSTYLFIDGANAVLASPKEICGKRFVLTHDPSNPVRDWSNTLHSAIEDVALELNCEILQSYANPDSITVASGLPKNWFISNYVFSKEINKRSRAVNPILNISPLDFNNSSIVDKIALYECLTRWNMPGSTIFSKDIYSSIKNEYSCLSDLYREDIIGGLCVNENNAPSFIFWFKDQKTKKAIIGFIWTDIKSRSKQIGTSLLNAATEALSLAGDIDSVDYFVSATNISAISMLNKSNFNLDEIVLNKYI